MIFTIIQVVLLILILVAVVPNVVRTFKAGKLKLGFALLLPLLAILGVISSISLHVTRGHQTVDPKILAKIDQLDAANVAADVQRFRQDHPEIKSTIQSETLSAEGLLPRVRHFVLVNRHSTRNSRTALIPLARPFHTGDPTDLRVIRDGFDGDPGKGILADLFADSGESRDIG